ncbi:MAG: hypothetical protein JEZ07_19880, partial [Phycisphaerae bacterium]|nr:hypothetical protein [Phycisphaerae bacterium]
KYNPVTGAVTDIKQFIYEDAANYVTKCVAWEKRDYDELGRVWRTCKLADPSTGVDQSGEDIVSYTPEDEDMVTLIQYDRQGKVIKQAVKGTNSTNYTDINDTADIVTENKYNEDSSLSYTYDPEDKLTAYLYDDYGRTWQVWREVDEGVSISSYTIAPDIDSDEEPDNLPVNLGVLPVNWALMSETIYDQAGRINESYDAHDNKTVPQYDSMGRTYKVQVTNDTTTLAQTRTQYDNLGNVIRQAVMADPGSTVNDSSISTATDKVTDYVYYGSEVDSDGFNHIGMLKKQINYGKSSTGTTTTTATLYEYDTFDRSKWVKSYNGNDSTPVVYSYSGIVYNAASQVRVQYNIELNMADNTENVTTITDMYYDKYGKVLKQRQLPMDLTTVSIAPGTIDAPGDIYNYTMSSFNYVSIPSGSSDCLVTQHVYDGLGRVICVKDPIYNNSNASDGSYTVHTYEEDFGKISSTEICDSSDNVCQRTEFDYDRLGRQKSITGYTDYATASTVKQVTTYAYDRLNRITTVTYPNENANQATIDEHVVYVYNSLSKVIERTDQRGKVTEYEYDIRGNLLKKEAVQWSGDLGTQESFTYDHLGRMKTAVRIDDVDGLVNDFSLDNGDIEISNTTFNYDHDTNITGEYEYAFAGPESLTDYYFGDSNTQKVTTFDYDQNGRNTSINYVSNTGTINTVRDYAGRISQLSLASSSIASYAYIGSKVAERTYIASGNNLVNDIDQNWSYDKYGRLAGLGSEHNSVEITDFTYAYDENSNITGKTFGHRNTDPANTYSYDDMNRLVETEYLGNSSDKDIFAYDDLGNRGEAGTTLRGDSSATKYAIDPVTNRYDNSSTTSPDVLCSYDDAGNLTKCQDNYEYEWDYENRLIRVFRMDGQNEVDVVKYTYDALGRRIQKDDCIADEQTLYYYNNNWQVLAEYDYDADATPTSTVDLLRCFVYGNYIDELIMMYDATQNGPSSYYYYVQDHLYSTAALISDSNYIVQRTEYDSYGKPKHMDKYYATGGAGVGNSYYFTGRRVDMLDGGDKLLQYSRNRYLDYGTGRWLSHDPLEHIDGLNLYQYINSRAIMAVDPFGLACDFHRDEIKFSKEFKLVIFTIKVEGTVRKESRNCDITCANGCPGSKSTNSTEAFESGSVVSAPIPLPWFPKIRVRPFGSYKRGSKNKTTYNSCTRERKTEEGCKTNVLRAGIKVAESAPGVSIDLSGGIVRSCTKCPGSPEKCDVKGRISLKFCVGFGWFKYCKEKGLDFFND